MPLEELVNISQKRKFSRLELLQSPIKKQKVENKTKQPQNHLQNEIDTLRTESYNWKLEREKLFDKLKQTELESLYAAQLRQERDSLVDRHETLLETLKTVKQEFTRNHTDKVAQLKAQINEIEQEYLVSSKSSKKQLQEYKADLAEAQSTIARLNSEFKEVQQNLSLKELEISELKNALHELADVKKSFEEAQKALEAQKIEATELRVSSKQLSMELDAKKQEIEALESTACVSTVSLSSLQNKLSHLNTQIASANSSVAQGEAKIAQLEIEIAEKDRALSEMELATSEATRQLHQLEVSHQLATHDVQTVRAQLAEYRCQIKTLQARLEDVTEMLTQEHTQQIHVTNLASEVAKMQADKDAILERLYKEQATRRFLHNQVLELKGNLRVFCRIRPLLSHETGLACATVEDNLVPTLAVKQPDRPPKQFHFDHVFGPGSSNRDIFQEISLLVQNALDGFDVCIFAYGQTGSGKTHTMCASDGVIPCTIEQIFDAVNQSDNFDYELSGEFVEIYNESVNDLVGEGTKLDIKHGNDFTTVEHAKRIALHSQATLVEMMELATKRRSVGATRMNQRSSRSHSVFMLHIKCTNAATGDVRFSTINLVDLAGSERISQSQVTGLRLKETQSINKSLSALGDVICALGTNSGHVPFRNSKLTFLLRRSLTGNAKTLMIVNVSPNEVHSNETLSSLAFATKVNSTKTKKLDQKA